MLSLSLLRDKKRPTALIASLVVSVVPVAMAPAAPADPAAAAAGGRYASEPDWIEVIFAPTSRVRLRDGALRDLGEPALAGVGVVLAQVDAPQWHRLTHLEESEIDAMRERGIANTGRDVPDLNNVYRLHVGSGEVWDLSAKLEALPGIALARPVPLPVPAPIPPAYAQEYRASGAWSPSGMGHDYFAQFPFGTGAGAHVCDLEYNWTFTHADVSKLAGSQINPTFVPWGGEEHGTAVAGMLVADDNGWGITGLCPDANFWTCGTYYGAAPTWNPAGAILIASAFLPPGGVILLEQQWDYDDPTTTGPDYVPIEFYLDYWPSAQTANAVYQAIQLATANLQYVVEAAGNGSYDLGSIGVVGDSGAIIVGAGGGTAGNDRQRLPFSSHGFRVNVQGWGENVVTTGYGTLWEEGLTDDYDFTATFSGTSSASAHVAGAVTVYSAFHTPTFGVLAPNTMRDQLILNGTDQVYGLPGYIGPRPDLMRLHMLYAPYPMHLGRDFGDAPEGVRAYPPTPIIGEFPTVFGPSVSPDAMMHAPHPGIALHLGSMIDYEFEGNGGVPYLQFHEVDWDECDDASPADDGLLFPRSFTIDGGTIAPCTTPDVLGPRCGLVSWGTDIDVEIVNQLPDPAYLNVIFDWNQDGKWGGSDNGCGFRVPELALENVPIPTTGATPVPLSQLVPGLPPIATGSGSVVWVRFTLTDTPLPFPATWDGGLGSGGWGVMPYGETEDFLLALDEESLAVGDGAGTGGAVLEIAGAFPNPFRSRIAIGFSLESATAVTVRIFDVSGRLVRDLGAVPLDAGPHRIVWDGRDQGARDVANGQYFATIRAADTERTVRLQLLR